MNIYRLRREEIPHNLYRVHYPGSRTHYDDQGFAAADTRTFISDYQIGLFVKSIENHLTCAENVAPSMYISAYSDRQHAENWAMRWSRNNGGQRYEIVHISPKAMAANSEIMVFHPFAQRLRRMLPRAAAANTISVEYLFLHKVPKAVIMNLKSSVVRSPPPQIVRKLRYAKVEDETSDESVQGDRSIRQPRPIERKLRFAEADQIYHERSVQEDSVLSGTGRYRSESIQPEIHRREASLEIKVVDEDRNTQVARLYDSIKSSAKALQSLATIISESKDSLGRLLSESNSVNSVKVEPPSEVRREPPKEIRREPPGDVKREPQVEVRRESDYTTVRRSSNARETTTVHRIPTRQASMDVKDKERERPQVSQGPQGQHRSLRYMGHRSRYEN